MSERLVIRNDGPRILSTTYWRTAYGREGVVYCSINAGALRVLLPPAIAGVGSAAELLAAAREASEVLVSRPRTLATDLRALVLELVWEDGTDTPYSLSVGAAQVDRLPPATEHGRSLRVSCWTEGPGGAPFCASDRPGRFRIVPRLPYLKPWETDQPSRPVR